MPIDELRQIAERLYHLIVDGSFIVWVGSGLSIGAGYPDWLETIDRLCSACGVQHLTSEEKSTEYLIDKAEECKRANIEAFQKTLADLFGKNIVQTRSAFQFLMRLPFKGYVTTNFDPLLCQAAALCGYNNIYSYPNLNFGALYKVERPVFHVHGLARQGNEPKGDKLVLARSDFDEAYGDIVRSFLDQMLSFHSILFMGCSLDDPYIKETFQRMHRIHKKIQETNSGVGLPKKYILLPKHQIFHKNTLGREISPVDFGEHNEEESNEEERFREMGINPIKFVLHDECYGEIDQILQYILEIGGEFKPPVPKSGFLEEVLSC